jgi:hypothetical protein
MSVSNRDLQQFDVAVVGAGVSGVPAAVTAARTGAKTLLLEQSRRIGGTMGFSLGFPVCGLFENNLSAPPRLLNEGLCAEWLNAVTNETADPVIAAGKVYVCRCPLPLFESIYESWATEDNIQFHCGIGNLAVETDGGRISSIRFQTVDGSDRICRVDQVIDCTGSGRVIELSAADRMVPEELPLAGFSVRLSGVQPDDLLAVKVPYILRKAVEKGALADGCAFTVFSPEKGGRALCKFSLPNGTGAAQAEELVRNALQLLREEIPALSVSKAVAFSPGVLQREGARLLGEYVLNAGDVRSNRRVDDCAAHGGWPMEYWDSQEGVQYEYIKNGCSYDIPLRSLRSVNIQNLWAAGRLISADSRALASARVMGTAIATGEAAGRAAAKECA